MLLPEPYCFEFDRQCASIIETDVSTYLRDPYIFTVEYFIVALVYFIPFFLGLLITKIIYLGRFKVDKFWKIGLYFLPSLLLITLTSYLLTFSLECEDIPRHAVCHSKYDF